MAIRREERMVDYVLSDLPSVSGCSGLDNGGVGVG